MLGLTVVSQPGCTSWVQLNAQVGDSHVRDTGDCYKCNSVDRVYTRVALGEVRGKGARARGAR